MNLLASPRERESKKEVFLMENSEFQSKLPITLDKIIGYGLVTAR